MTVAAFSAERSTLSDIDCNLVIAVLVEAQLSKAIVKFFDSRLTS